MKKYILVILAMGFTTLCFAQNTYQAQILDEESGNPLVGASLYFPQLEIGGTADSNGLVSVSGIPDGSHNLQVQYLGYETQFAKVTFPLENKELIVFSLHHAHEELETLVVQSNRSSRLIEDVPTRVEIIAGEELSE